MVLVFWVFSGVFLLFLVFALLWCFMVFSCVYCSGFVLVSELCDTVNCCFLGGLGLFWVFSGV